MGTSGRVTTLARIDGHVWKESLDSEAAVMENFICLTIVLFPDSPGISEHVWKGSIDSEEAVIGGSVGIIVISCR